MHHATPLISTIVVGLVLAFIFGLAAQRMKLSPLVGYLLAGVAVGPFTPGYVADQGLANELAELGVILLMFGVGLHFSVKDLWAQRKIALPGALAQILVAVGLGCGLALLLGWGVGAGLVFGLALSVASTVVLLRALQERRLVETPKGRLAVGWLIVEDLVMVLALVLLPAFAGGGGAGQLGLALALTLGKVALFAALMLVVGRRVVPWILHYVAHTRSRELFRLSVLAISLGVAFGAAKLFGVSFALGAFFAGMILSESELSQRAAEETLPLRDAFAVLFFVSVGMLFDPTVLWREPLAVLGTLVIILVGKSLASLAILHVFRQPRSTGLLISASLAQIGEFSFILATLGLSLGLLNEAAQDLILAGAILSIVLNPFLFVAIDKLEARRKVVEPAAVSPPEAAGERPQALDGDGAAATDAADAATAVLGGGAAGGRVLVVGHGRVGGIVSGALASAGRDYAVVEDRDAVVEELNGRGVAAFAGNGVDRAVLAAAGGGAAACVVVTLPDPFEAGQVVEQARALKRDVRIIARAHSDAAVAHLRQHGADEVIMGERQIADAMIAWLGGAPPRPARALEPAGA